ncbi:uncharacterized protein LOC109604696 isoform X2 [Aethina tumida]|uniref:uncharacterized protein LOC109604696 isoform X2 n=1 Tax=Aethina tumida TaxID=116153 RepID=UPI0021492C54|nr:uncharacterized protein LOC109604696 isoform X2 [Aethina tumida]
MSRDEVHLRDRLLMLAECSNPHRPFNIKRKSLLAKHSSKTAPKLSVQDFVRMDPGYTPDIEHLVFPTRKRNPQQVAPINPPTPAKTRSRLVEMFALSRHLQQRSADRETKTRNPAINRSVDSVLEGSPVVSQRGASLESSGRRWVSAAEEPLIRQNSTTVSSTSAATRLSPNKQEAEAGPQQSSRGPNVSVLHLRSTSEPWETSPTSAFTSSTGSSSRSYFANRSTGSSNPPPLTKHQSLGGPVNTIYNNSKWQNSPSFHSGGEVNSPDIFTSGNQCNRELSPVRWCDREVDGVYLGRSGWVQVQQRSLDESRRYSGKAAANSLQSSRRTGMKLADYHCNSEPGNCPEVTRPNDSQRPVYLSLQTKDFERKTVTPSPRNIPETYSPPSLTPIISPPPAFQDKNKSSPKSRTFFGKTPFLPRSNAIEDSDASPPTSPTPMQWKSLAPNLPQSIGRKTKTVVSPVKEQPPLRRIPQTKSLEDTTAVRRSKFVQRYGESSSSSSSSMGFRSLDSTVNRNIMPRLSENTDSSVDVYEDADDEDNNSSSINISMTVNVQNDFTRPREKISPSSRPSSRIPHHRQQTRRSPAGSDSNKQPTSPSSTSSSDSMEFLSRSPPQPIRRSAPTRPYQHPVQPQEDISRVRRSRSLQLPEKKPPAVQSRISPQHPDSHRVVVKIGNAPERQKRINKPQSLEVDALNEELLREAEVVTGYNNNNVSKEDKNKEPPKLQNNGLTVYYVGNSKKDKQKVLVRGSTTPNLQPSKTVEAKNPCNSDTCDFWPHCASRDSLNREAQYIMRSSQSYPTHQRSLDSSTAENGRKPKRRLTPETHRIERQHRVSPSRASLDEKKPQKSASGSSSGSERFVVSGAKTGRKVKSASPPEDKPREMILTRPGSAPAEQRRADGAVENQQRSMSLPKSFLSASYQQGSQTPLRRRGTESLGSSPGCQRKVPTPEVSHTAPVTPLHENNRRRSPISGAARKAKASSTPQLLEEPISDSRKWAEKIENPNISPVAGKDFGSRRNLNASTTESVLQKFRKTFSLKFQQKKQGGSKESCGSDVGDNLSEILAEPSEEESPQHVPSLPLSPSSNCPNDSKDENTEQKYRFGPLIWRTSKERKKLNKAARSAKCNSGDSGIQIEMVPSCGGAGDSSESHDTDPPGDELDSPPTVRRRPPHGKLSRPHSDLLNQILIDKFKADLKQRAHRNQQVRRTRSDLGGQRLLNWDPRSSYRRLMSSPAHHLRPGSGGSARLQSPNKKPPDAPGGVQLRSGRRRGQLRRSLSQPLDIDKLSPLMRTKTAGLRVGGSNILSEDEQDARLGTSDDEAMSDSESSIASLNERKKSLELAMDEEMVILAEAVFDHVAIEAEELAFRAGDVIEVLETANRDWWWGSTKGKSGWFPAQFVRLRVSQEDTVEDCLAAMASGRPVTASIRRRTSISLLSNDQVRTSVVRELVHTERDFVKVLRDVAEGYVSECRKRKDMFNQEQIATIFINLEQILQFQSAFLKDLEACIDWDSPYKSCVGGCFLKHKDGFKMYSDYCNSHPLATAALQELYQYNNYSKFFEACRLMRGLIEIPLDGYLLTPVQRICKYPLQLAELLKYTKTDHQDYKSIKDALEVMRDVATLINERKRRMESLEKLCAWQQRVEGWEGEDLIEHSSQLIHQGEVVKVTSGMWTNNITLFLFDHQIVYCKKDILKRNTFVYKGRICLDTCEVIDVPDGKDLHSGVNVRHGIKLYSCVRDKWLMFCCRSANDKQRWLRLFSEERRIVGQDKDSGLDLPAAARQLARLAARSQRRPPRKPRSGKNFKHDSGYMGSTLQLNTSNSNSLGRKMGTWFTFGTNKKSRHQQQQDIS